MPTRHSVPLALILLLAASLPPSAFAQRPTPPQSTASAQAQSRTLGDIRTVGTALFAWLTDQVGTQENNETTYDPKAESACVSAVAGNACDVAFMDRIPIVSHQELTELLVPDYIESIPEKDGWGNLYEFRLDKQHVFNTGIMSIRSAGSDRTFSGNRYERGTFAPIDTVEDLVWMDGFLVRWPQRKDPTETHDAHHHHP